MSGNDNKHKKNGCHKKAIEYQIPVLTVMGESRALVEVLDLKLSSTVFTYFHSPAEFVTEQNNTNKWITVHTYSQYKSKENFGQIFAKIGVKVFLPDNKLCNV